MSSRTTALYMRRRLLRCLYVKSTLCDCCLSTVGYALGGIARTYLFSSSFIKTGGVIANDSRTVDTSRMGRQALGRRVGSRERPSVFPHVRSGPDCWAAPQPSRTPRRDRHARSLFPYVRAQIATRRSAPWPPAGDGPQGPRLIFSRKIFGENLCSLLCFLLCFLALALCFCFPLTWDASACSC